MSGLLTFLDFLSKKNKVQESRTTPDTPKENHEQPTRIGRVGLELVKHFEGLYLKAYLCPANVWTIGYGHTGQDVEKGQVITAQEAEELLAEDMRVFERAVVKLVKVPLKQHQFDALVSFSFNVGSGALGSSTLLKLLNAGDYQGAADQFPRWNKGGGKILPGLVRRRAAERNLFLGQDLAL